MPRRPLPRLLLTALLAGGCSASDASAPTPNACPLPPAPTGRGSLVLATAGAPVALFGPVEAPTFGPVFRELEADGFDWFFPVFQTSEAGGVGTSTRHGEWFLPPRCDAGANPYDALPGALRVLFPAFLLVPEAQWVTGMRAEPFRSNLQALRSTCLSRRPDAVAAYASFDEPVSATIGTRLDDDPTNDFQLANVATLYDELRARTGRPVVQIEGPLPFGLDVSPDLAGLDSATRAQLRAAFWAYVAESARYADWYGFDLYPVDRTADLRVVGQYVDEARTRAPNAQPLVVLQGFGERDLGSGPGRRPTPDETRAMAYQAVVRGARAVGWYGQSAIEPSAPLWAAIRATARELRRLAPVLDLPAVQLTTATDVSVAARRGTVGELYAVYANPTSEARAVRLTPPAGWGRYRVYDLARSAVVGEGQAGGEFTWSVSPYQAGAYVLVACR